MFGVKNLVTDHAIEPAAVADGFDPRTRAAMSIAISLKRIADALQAQSDASNIRDLLSDIAETGRMK